MPWTTPGRTPAIDQPAVPAPYRTCVGCRRRRPSTALVRITCVGEQVVVDGPSAGRGAWVCRAGEGIDPVCIDRGVRTGGLRRAWRREVDAGLQQAVRAALAEWGAGAPGDLSRPG